MILGLGLFAWFGLLAALCFLSAALVAATRVVTPKKRIRYHRSLAVTGLLFMTLHALWALSARLF